ncbi:MAG TPA: FtsX-like permease family protein, partial [Bryobacteraceae bacterium]|nr:FtsX-like permease family protein [Bryobacteraceae bacterium]
SAPKVAVVNEAFAKAFFGGANPLGRTFNVEADAGKPEDLYQVVGLVKNTKYYDLREEFKPVSYVPMLQDSEPGASTQFVIRINGPVAETLRNLKAAVAEVSPGIGLEYRFLSRRLQDSLMRERLMATLSGAFGLLAGLLATLGLYGVIAYMVARRRNEIGLRMALGAGRGSVVRLVLREAVLLLTVGFVVGGLLAVWAGRAIETMVFGLKPYDPMTMLAAMAMLAAVALAASYGPARKAASLDPMAALRDE